MRRTSRENPHSDANARSRSGIEFGNLSLLKKQIQLGATSTKKSLLRDNQVLDPLSSQTKCNTLLRGCCHGPTVSAAVVGRAMHDCPASNRRALGPANRGSSGS